MPRALQLPPNQRPLITDPFRHHHTHLCCVRTRAHTRTHTRRNTPFKPYLPETPANGLRHWGAM